MLPLLGVGGLGGFSKGMEFADFVAAVMANPDEARDRRLRSQGGQLAGYQLYFLGRLETIEKDVLTTASAWDARRRNQWKIRRWR